MFESGAQGAVFESRVYGSVCEPWAQGVVLESGMYLQAESGRCSYSMLSRRGRMPLWQTMRPSTRAKIWKLLSRVGAEGRRRSEDGRREEEGWMETETGQ